MCWESFRSDISFLPQKTPAHIALLCQESSGSDQFAKKSPSKKKKPVSDYTTVLDQWQNICSDKPQSCP